MKWEIAAIAGGKIMAAIDDGVQIGDGNLRDSKMSDKRFAGKSVLITGGSRGIGRACALAFARNGADVAINFNKSEDEAKEVMRTAESLGVKSQIFRADTSKSSEVGAMVEEVFSGFGKIDILVNNAGVLKRTPFLQISEEEWDWVLEVDLKGYFPSGAGCGAAHGGRKDPREHREYFEQ